MPKDPAKDVSTEETKETQEPDLGAAIAALTQKIEALKTSPEKPPDETPEEPPKQAAKPPAPPTRPDGRQTAQATQQYMEELAKFGTEQAQKAYAYELAHNMGVDPQALLDADHSRPEDMLAHAERMAEREANEARIKALEERLQAMVDGRAQTPEEETVPPASVDTGGPTSTKSEAERDLEARYEAAKAAGKTEHGRRMLLEAIYRDPSKIRRVQSEHVG